MEKLSTCLLFLGIIFSVLPHRTFEDEEEVFCDFKANCVLPCNVQPGPDLVVNWEKPQMGYISRYRYGKDDGTKLQEYTNRTSVFVEEISKGKASMLLKEVIVQDEGLYCCFTSTSDTRGLRITSVRVRVRAPVVDVSLELREQQLLCRSKCIYPKPTVTWTFNPEPQEEPQTIFTESETGLFSVFSAAPLTLSSPLQYICKVSTVHSSRSAIYRTNPEVDFSNTVVVPCVESTAPVKSLVWRFNNKETIFNRTGSKDVFVGLWTQFGDGITLSNSLVLKNLSQNQKGLYSCELSTESETFVIVTNVTDAKRCPEGTEHLGPVIGVLGLIVLVAVLFFLYQIRKGSRNPRKREQNGELGSVPKPDDEGQQESAELTETGRESTDDESCDESVKLSSLPNSGSYEDTSGYGQSGCSSSMGSSA